MVKFFLFSEIYIPDQSPKEIVMTEKVNELKAAEEMI